MRLLAMHTGTARIDSGHRQREHMAKLQPGQHREPGHPHLLRPWLQLRVLVRRFVGARVHLRPRVIGAHEARVVEHTPLRGGSLTCAVDSSTNLRTPWATAAAPSFVDMSTTRC